MTGFCVSVSPAGKRCFYFYGRVHGQPKRVKLGTFPEMNATDARECCKALIGDVARGKDVIGERKGARRTLGDLWVKHERSIVGHKLRTHKKLKATWNNYLSNWQHKRLVEIRRGTIAELISHLEATHSKSAARDARSLLSSMFATAMALEWVEYNPVKGTVRPQYEARDRYIRKDELPRFLGAVESLKRQSTRDLIYLALYTGARRANLGSMEWGELDLERGLWTIPKNKFKGKREKVIPLIPLALEILRRRQNDRAGGNPWVFPSSGASGHLTDPKKSMARIRKLSGIEGLRFHDLRRSLGAWQNASGISLRIIQQTLGHSSIATTASHYTPAEHEAVRAATAATIEAVMNGKVGK